MLGEAVAAAAKTNTFLGERYRRLVKRRGKLRALVAVARSILVIVWHLLYDPIARFYDLGPDYHTHRIDTTRKIQNHVSGLTAWAFASPSNPPPDPRPVRVTAAVVSSLRPGSASRGHAEPVVPFPVPGLIFRSDTVARFPVPTVSACAEPVRGRIRRARRCGGGRCADSAPYVRSTSANQVVASSGVPG